MTRHETVHSLSSSIEDILTAGGTLDSPQAADVVHDVELCVRTVVDQECGTLAEHRELGLRILRRLGVSPVGAILNY
jgi:hypothetical protein